MESLEMHQSLCELTTLSKLERILFINATQLEDHVSVRSLATLDCEGVSKCCFSLDEKCPLHGISLSPAFVA